MDKKIKTYLEKINLKYEPSEHRTIYTAFNAAETQHVDTKSVVKTVLIKLDKAFVPLWAEGPKIEKIQHVLVSIPAHKRVDFKKISQFIFDTQTKFYKKRVKNEPKLGKPLKLKSSMAKEKELAAKLGIKKGLASPLPIYNTPILFDKKLTKPKKISINAGSFTESLTVSASAYIKAINPLLGNFTE